MMNITIFKIVVVMLDLIFTAMVGSAAMILIDKESDGAALGAFGIILLLILINTFVLRILFSKPENTR